MRIFKITCILHHKYILNIIKLCVFTNSHFFIKNEFYKYKITSIINMNNNIYCDVMSFWVDI